MVDNKKDNNFNNLSLKWKGKRWYVGVLFNMVTPFLLAINRVLHQNSISDQTIHLFFSCFLLPIFFSLLMYYFYSVFKEAKIYKGIIKESRFKYFWNTIFISLLLFSLVFVGLVVSITVSESVNNIVVWTMFGIASVCGFISCIFLTMYEFCASFDIFYKKNKEIIIKEYLEKKLET